MATDCILYVVWDWYLGMEYGRRGRDEERRVLMYEEGRAILVKSYPSRNRIKDRSRGGSGERQGEGDQDGFSRDVGAMTCA